MYLLILSHVILLISNIPMVKNDNFYQKDRCQILGDRCYEDSDCCSSLSCYSIEDENICLQRQINLKRDSEDFIPPYYQSKTLFEPHRTRLLLYPFYNAYVTKSSRLHHRNKKEWDQCQYHDDCGDENCCYPHFRFRSLPKSFCRPNRNKSEPCEPLDKYRSFKNIPNEKSQNNYVYPKLFP